MNCSLCGLPQDTGALGSVLPQCICHWKHTPYQGTPQTELNAGGEPVKNATYWKRQHDKLADRIAELEKQLNLHKNAHHKCVEILQEKQSEPVGRYYWESVADGIEMAIPSATTPHYMKDDFPLYLAPQTKLLSDEEIWDCWVKSHGNTEYTKAKAFYRAIEAKVRGDK